jgi:biopolymer transport protein ExbD
MRFPRQARVFSGRLDAAPFAGVFFSLLILLVLTGLVRTPGVGIELPRADGLPGETAPALAVALDKSGRLYFENQLIQPAALRERLAEAVKRSSAPLTLVVQADKAVSYETLLRVTLLARESGLRQIHLATLPRPLAPNVEAP